MRDNRRAIIEAVTLAPGISLRSLAAKVDLSLSGTWHHVKYLEAEGVLTHGKCPGCGQNRWEVNG